MNPEPLRFEAAFASALLAPAPTAHAWDTQPAFAVYRNTVMKSCIDALAANFPAVLRLTGAEWFRAAAADHVRATPPGDARLVVYGADFASFLRHFPPARELPYLADVAALDRLWVESHVAADAPALTLDDFASRSPEALAPLRLVPHPAARWAWCDAHPAYTLWSCNRVGDGALPETIDWHGEGTLVTRCGHAVQWCALTPGGCAFLDGCAGGATLAEAADAALAREPSLDLAQLIAQLSNAGALSLRRGTPGDLE
jgi:hypothetical protein